MKLLDLLHRWGGGLLGLILAVLGLSGAILVHKEEWIGLPHAADARVTDPAQLGQLADRLLAGASGGESIVFASDRFGLVQLRDGAGGLYLLKQHTAAAAREQPGLAKKRVSPHVLRHTCAMIILQATQDIRKVSLWLGHATMTTTEVYTRGDPTEKLDAMEAIVPPHLRRGTFQPTDKLMALLKSTT
jgi:hypothetical protein